MQLGLALGYSGKHVQLPMALIKHAETLGFGSAWTAEAYGSDAVTTAAWILAQTENIKVGTAIMQIPGRSPALAAMTAMTLNQLSGGRFMLGLGPSGPQVTEGWHGVSYARPLSRMREYVAIVRKIFAREEPLSFAGGHYQLPYAGADATGLGKPLKTILAADPSLPVYTAAITPGGVRLAAEVADGFFPVWMNPERFDLFADAIEQGFAKAGGTKTLADFDVAPFVQVVLGDDLEQCRNVLKPGLALYIGGMGAPGKNFYTDYTGRLGYEAEAKRIQELYLGGQQQEAIAMVPDALVDDIYLVGPAARIRERLQVWKTAGGRHQVGSMLLGTAQPEALEVIAAEVL